MKTYATVVHYLLGPLGFCFLLFFDLGMDALTQKTLACAWWMVSWWIFEVVPIYITAMLPMVLFPTLGIMSVKETFEPYASPIIFLFLGGFIIALAMEERGLHKRIAFSLVRICGTKPRGIILGFMLATAAVGMWISNTATAVMMLPIGVSIIRLIETDELLVGKQLQRFAMLLMLAIAYGANIGGTMTLIGTPPNLVFAGLYRERYGLDIDFAEWMGIGLPVGLMMLGLGYLLLTRVVYPMENTSMRGVKTLIENQWIALGRIERPEALVIGIFSFTVFCWIFLNPINRLLGADVLSNTTVAMLGGLLMFLTPVSFMHKEFLLEWKSTIKLPWGILILFGGGLTLANSFEAAGLIDAIGIWVTGHARTSPLLLCLVLTVVALFMTELMSNVALVTVLLPVVFGIGEGMGLHPYYLAIPVTLAASCAFMMPISTPPNAVVFSSGRVKVTEMMRAGVWMNLLAIGLIIGIGLWLIDLLT